MDRGRSSSPKYVISHLTCLDRDQDGLVWLGVHARGAAHRSGAILQLDTRLASLRPRSVQWVFTARDATVVRPEICEQAWRHVTVFLVLYAAVYKEARHDEGILFRRMGPDPLRITMQGRGRRRHLWRTRCVCRN